MFSSRETVAGPDGVVSGSDLPQQRMEFVLLSGSKQPHLSVSKTGWTRRASGTAGAGDREDAGIAHLGLPTCEHRSAEDEYVCTCQPGKTEAWTHPHP